MSREVSLYLIKLILKLHNILDIFTPFTSEVAGSILSENVLNVSRTQCFTRVKIVSQHSAESRSSFLPQGN